MEDHTLGVFAAARQAHADSERNRNRSRNRIASAEMLMHSSGERLERSAQCLEMSARRLDASSPQKGS